MCYNIPCFLKNLPKLHIFIFLLFPFFSQVLEKADSLSTFSPHILFSVFSWLSILPAVTTTSLNYESCHLAESTLVIFSGHLSLLATFDTVDTPFFQILPLKNQEFLGYFLVLVCSYSFSLFDFKMLHA